MGRHIDIEVGQNGAIVRVSEKEPRFFTFDRGQYQQQQFLSEIGQYITENLLTRGQFPDKATGLEISCYASYKFEKIFDDLTPGEPVDADFAEIA